MQLDDVPLKESENSGGIRARAYWSRNAAAVNAAAGFYFADRAEMLSFAFRAAAESCLMFTHCIRKRRRIAGNDRQQSPGRPSGLAPSLLPILHGVQGHSDRRRMP